MRLLKNRVGGWVLLASWSVASAGIWGGAASVLATPQPPKAESVVADSNAKSLEGPVTSTEDSLRFVRIDRDGEEPRAMQTAIARYEIQSGPFQGRHVDLVGAVHIGTKDYYHRLNKLFQSYDALLYELVADANANRPDLREEEGGFNPLAGLQKGMKDALNLDYQLVEIDYSPKNFVHADMSPSEFAADMKERKDGFVSMFARLVGAGLAEQANKRAQQQQSEMLAAMLTKDTMRMRRVIAEQFDRMEGQMAGFADKNGKSTILTERNRKAFEVLRSELEAGKKKLGIFYGAAHLKDMHERLIRDFDAKLIETQWLDAWPLQ